MNEMHVIRQSCVEALDLLFEPGERIPVWANVSVAWSIAYGTGSKDGYRGGHAIKVESAEHQQLSNKVIVMDPPTLILAEVRDSELHETGDAA